MEVGPEKPWQHLHIEDSQVVARVVVLEQAHDPARLLAITWGTGISLSWRQSFKYPLIYSDPVDLENMVLYGKWS